MDTSLGSPPVSQLTNSLKHSPIFMDSNCSFLRLQEPATGLYIAPVQSSPVHAITHCLFKSHFLCFEIIRGVMQTLRLNN